MMLVAKKQKFQPITLKEFYILDAYLWYREMNFKHV